MEVLFNPILIVTVAFAAILTVSISKIFRRGSREKKKRYQPVAGTIFHLLLNFNRLHHYLADQSRKYRSFRILNLTRSEVYTADPANVEYILKTNFQNYGRVSTN